MRNFSYHRAASAEEARREAGAAGALLLAGGTTLLDLAKCGVAEPDKVVDITHLKGLDAIRVTAEGAFIGALAKMSRVAEDSGIKANSPPSRKRCGRRPPLRSATWRAWAAI